MKESKRERFDRVVAARVNKATKMITLIGNCSNKNNYEYTDGTVKQVFAYLQKQLDKARARFEDNKKPFSLTRCDLGSFSVDVIRQSNGLYDVYIAHEGNSGEHYTDVNADEIGRLLAEDVECIDEAYSEEDEADV